MSTARELITRVATDLGELIPSTATAPGTAVALVDTSLRMYFPVNAANLNAWVYGTNSNNAGKEARAASWAATESTLSLYAPGFPAQTVAGDTYEIHLRTRRSLKLDAINEAIALLGMHWFVEREDESITMVKGTYEYLIPFPAGRFNRLVKLEAQSSLTEPDNPYATVDPSGYSVRRSTDDAGTTVFTLQLNDTSLRDGYKLRLTGELSFSELVADTDVLPTDGAWNRAAETWVVAWAVNHVLGVEARSQPASNASRYEASLARLDKQLEKLLRDVPTRSPSRIRTPGRLYL